MRVIAIISLTVFGFWLITVQWGILAILVGCVVWWLIASDKNGHSIETFSALCFGVILLGGFVAGVRALVF